MRDYIDDDLNHIKSEHIESKEKSGGISEQVQSFIRTNPEKSKFNAM